MHFPFCRVSNSWRRGARLARDWPLTGIQSRWPGNQPMRPLLCVLQQRQDRTGQDRTGQGCADVNRRIKITFLFVE